MWKEGMALVAFDVDPTTATDFWYLGIPKLGHTHINLQLKKCIPYSSCCYYLCSISRKSRN